MTLEYSYSSDNKLADEIAYNSGYVTAGYELAAGGIDSNFSPVIDLTSDSRVLCMEEHSHHHVKLLFG